MRLAIQYVSDEQGNTSAVQISMDEWKKLVTKIKKYEQLLKLRSGLEEGFADVKKIRAGKQKKQSLLEFLDEL